MWNVKAQEFSFYHQVFNYSYVSFQLQRRNLNYAVNVIYKKWRLVELLAKFFCLHRTKRHKAIREKLDHYWGAKFWPILRIMVSIISDTLLQWSRNVHPYQLHRMEPRKEMAQNIN